MSNFLTEIRNKSDQQKKKILFVSTFLAMIVVLATWYFLSTTFGAENQINQTNGNDINLAGLEELYNNFTGEFNQIIDSFSK